MSAELESWSDDANKLRHIWVHVGNADFFEQFVPSGETRAHARAAALIGARATTIIYLNSLDDTPCQATANCVRARFDEFFAPVISPLLQAIRAEAPWGKMLDAVLAGDYFQLADNLNLVTPGAARWTDDQARDPKIRLEAIADVLWITSASACPILLDYLRGIGAMLQPMTDIAAQRARLDAAPAPVASAPSTFATHLEVVDVVNSGRVTDPIMRDVIGAHSITEVATTIVEAMKADANGDSVRAQRLLSGADRSKMRRALGKTLMSIICAGEEAAAEAEEAEDGDEESLSDVEATCKALYKIVAQRAAGKSWIDAIISGWHDVDGSVRKFLVDSKIDNARLIADCTFNCGESPSLSATEYAFTALLAGKVGNVRKFIRSASDVNAGIAIRLVK